MADINRYSRRTPSLSDLLLFWSTSNGDTSACSLTELQDLLVPDGSDEVTQYAAPSATGFTATISETAGRDVWLVLTPVAGYAAGTIALPAASASVHGQEIVVNCTQSVTTLTVSSSGGTVTGAPTTLAANAFFRLKFEDVTNTWYRVG